jgi:anaerobic dimethyl sulfoxide reductase subunit A
MTHHSLHCGGACLLKLHLRDGMICQITSAGDIPRRDSLKADESLLPIQRRACLKGYAEMKRIYAPDRLKYPLKQTAERGNPRGFKRISWDEALDHIAGYYSEMRQRERELGYWPVWDEGGITPYLGTCLKRFGSYSFGNLAAAMFGAVGKFFQTRSNPVMDIFNAKYIVVWASDHCSSRPPLPFFMLKAREAGIPITVVDSRYTDTAACMGTGKGPVPGFICLRPGTDTVLLAAMANVIFRHNLQDAAFLKEYCFGFYPGDSVVSRSAKKHPVSGQPYAGTRFDLPSGQSFIEYLDELQVHKGGYSGLLDWASAVTGVPPEVIENLAIEYATAKPAFIYTSYHGGAQRTHNGMYLSWLLIALSALTGNINKRGGGFGDVRLDDGYRVQLGPPPAGILIKNGPSPATGSKPILFSVFKDSDVIINGLDGRTPGELRSDVLAMNNIDLGPQARLHLEMYVKGAICSNTFNQTQNINKRLIAWQKLKHAVAYERFLTTTATWCDIVLPAATDFEESCFGTNLFSDTFAVNGPVACRYEIRPDWWINEQIADRLGVNYPHKTLTDRQAMQKQWELAVIPPDYKNVDPAITLPGFAEMIEKADFQLPVPPDKTVVQLQNVQPGEYDTDTGKINFYSPYFAERGRSVLKENAPRHIEYPAGYEEAAVCGGIGAAKGLKYTLQFVSPHLPQRAHTTFDNVPLLKELLPHAVEIHPQDAAARQIRHGDQVYVFNDYGCLKLPAVLTSRIMPGVVSIGQGTWYRPSHSETYEAWFDTDYDGVAEKHVVAVDEGGCVNSITPDLNSGVLDPFCDGLGMNANGAFCEISLSKP